MAPRHSEPDTHTDSGSIVSSSCSPDTACSLAIGSSIGVPDESADSAALVCAQPHGVPVLGIALIRHLARSGCAISKVQGGWPQRVRNLRVICTFAESPARETEFLFEEERDDAARSLGDLSETLCKLAQLEASPAGIAKTSGAARKRFAQARSAVGYFVGSDLIRALLTDGPPRTIDICSTWYTPLSPTLTRVPRPKSSRLN